MIPHYIVVVFGNIAQAVLRLAVGAVAFPSRPDEAAGFKKALLAWQPRRKPAQRSQAYATICKNRVILGEITYFEHKTQIPASIPKSKNNGCSMDMCEASSGKSTNQAMYFATVNPYTCLITFDHILSYPNC